jgi:hypothetical protein
MLTAPFEANAARHYCICQQRHRMTNRPGHDAASLRQRVARLRFP